MKAVIMAGGRGTRISPVVAGMPKPMIPIDGKPVLEHEIECLRDQGFCDILITVGHLKQAIMNYFGDGSGISPVTGEPFGVRIDYFVEQEPLGNAGALFRIKDQLTEDFLLLNADVLFDVDFNRFVDFHKKRGGVATIFSHPNSHPYDSGVIITDDNDSVERWLSKEDVRPVYYANKVNAGLHVLSPQVLDLQIDTPKVDLDRHILKPLSGTGKLYAYTSPEYVKDMGTPERYEAVCNDFITGMVQAKNLRNQQRAVFLDRDGTINRYVGFLTNIDDFELLPGVAEAIRKINTKGYLAIVVSNQPVIARGEVTYAQMREIHNKMETLLGAEGAYLDAIFYCPHHPHSGYDGEIAQLKIDCSCRKPKPGMLLNAAREFHIDLANSWMVGDSENDVKAGRAAGCHTALLAEAGVDFGQETTVHSLSEFVSKILLRGEGESHAS